MIVAASTVAPNSPIPNSASASRPATGSSACAASAADVIGAAAGPIVGGRRDDDEDGDQVGPDGPGDRVRLLERQLLLADALLGHADCR